MGLRMSEWGKRCCSYRKWYSAAVEYQEDQDGGKQVSGRILPHSLVLMWG